MPELVTMNEVVELTDCLTYLKILISPEGLAFDEISARVQKARLAFTNLLTGYIRYQSTNQRKRLLCRSPFYSMGVEHGHQEWAIFGDSSKQCSCVLGPRSW